MQNLPIWAEFLHLDVETEVYQRRPMSPDEFVNGLLKEQRLSTQTFNSLMYLLTSHSNPSAYSLTLWDTRLSVPETAVVADGSVPDQTETPLLYAAFPTGLPNPPKPAGFTYLLRKM